MAVTVDCRLLVSQVLFANMSPVSVFNLPNAHLDVFRSTPSRRRDERRGTEPLSPLTWWSPKYILWSD